MSIRRFILLFVFILLGQSLAGVIHESKTIVKFKGFGEYSTHETVYIQGLKQHKESSNNFEAQGMMGKMISGLLFRDKNKGEITDLETMKIFDLLHDKKQYRVRPIEKMEFDEEYSVSEGTETEQGETEESQSSIKITRQVFKVEPTGKQKTINNFPCKEYNVFWVTEWVNTETGEKGKDSLFTDVWTTESTGTIESALKEERQFQKTYLKKVGLDMDVQTEAILGLNWIQMFQAMSQGNQQQANFSESKWVKEMKKIKGFPVIIDGKYYATRPGGKKEMKEKKSTGFDFKNPTGMFGNMLKKKLKEKSKPKTSAHEPDFAFHTELLKLESKGLSKDRFKVPAGYTLIEE